MPRRGAALPNALLVLLAVGLCLLAAELAARWLEAPPPDLGDGGFESFRESGEFTPALNARGFREREPGGEVHGVGWTRILFLGDSFTFGSGVRDGEARFTDRIEQRLNEAAGRAGRADRYHVYNAAWPGTNPSHWYGHLKELLPVYDPHVVFAVFFLRSGTSLCTSLQCHRAAIAALRARYSERPGYRISALARVFYERMLWRDFARDYQRQIVQAYLGDDAERETWLRERFSLRRLRELAESSGAGFHLIVFPMLFELDRYPYRQVEAEIARFAEESGIATFHLLPGFEGRDARALWVSERDQHPNEEGHRVAAETLSPYVARVVDAPRPLR